MAGFTDQVPSLLASRYLVGAQIARGGMSVVYRAWDSVLNRDVAVKMLDLFVADPAARERFTAEGQTLSGLNHPGLTMLFDAGAHDDRPYLVMELVDGDTLTQHYRRWHLDRGEVISIGIALAEALTYVHGCGIVHRDIKPSNVLIGRDRRVRLADFGIARLLGDASIHTATGVTVGTAAYLSPEQVRGEPATGASDIYALGLVLLEALAGRPVFTGTPDVVALARLIGPPPIDETLPPVLRELLAGMTADQAVDRPTAGQVAICLREAAAEAGPSMVATRESILVPDAQFPASEPVEPLASPPTATGQTNTPPTDPRPGGATVPDPLPDATASRRRLLGWSLGAAAALLLVPALVLESPLTGGGDRPAPSARSVPGSTGAAPATAGPRPTSSAATTVIGSAGLLAPVNTVVASPAPVTGAASTPVASSTTARPEKAKGKSNGKGNGNKGNGNNGNGNGNGNDGTD
jgi:eukaryotic-like serine/threonine-protein kinase